MRVGDLVKLSKTFTNDAAIEDWGCGLIEEVYTEYFSVEVIWPQKSWTTRTIPWSRVEVVSESR